MDTGKGGCNDNVVYGNDFSHAPTNGIETTFSRNVFANNKVYECWHGVWGGYSYDSQFVGNRFGYNAEAIAIEHGQNNTIRSNIFSHDSTGIGSGRTPPRTRTGATRRTATQRATITRLPPTLSGRSSSTDTA
jgi:hypothetical protein